MFFLFYFLNFNNFFCAHWEIRKEWWSTDHSSHFPCFHLNNPKHCGCTSDAAGCSSVVWPVSKIICYFNWINLKLFQPARMESNKERTACHPFRRCLHRWADIWFFDWPKKLNQSTEFHVTKIFNLPRAGWTGDTWHAGRFRPIACIRWPQHKTPEKSDWIE